LDGSSQGSARLERSITDRGGEEEAIQGRIPTRSWVEKGWEVGNLHSQLRPSHTSA